MEIEYSREHWELLKNKRDRAIEILRNLRELGIEGYVYGSVARGDVKKGSDIDIIVFNPDLLKLELVPHHHKFIVQATPFSTPKAYISLDEEEKEIISFPLNKLKRKEIEFYHFGGLVSFDDLLKNKRVAGVNKILELIIPSEKGHIQLPLVGNEDYAVKLLKISHDTILEREKLLEKREERGHTGVFLKYELDENESFEYAIRNLSKNNKFFRRMMNA
ncbi:nucleotidyltransferase domain-containing protein [Sulfurisphaera javensis]|uniref:protein adenylyltransferase n=1 Tax=Sulfurisphaera javensis TaxID=2049879 RepID=A0AAT9GPB2_9CREN